MLYKKFLFVCCLLGLSFNSFAKAPAEGHEFKANTHTLMFSADSGKAVFNKNSQTYALTLSRINPWVYIFDKNLKDAVRIPTSQFFKHLRWFISSANEHPNGLIIDSRSKSDDIGAQRSSNIQLEKIVGFSNEQLEITIKLQDKHEVLPTEFQNMMFVLEAVPIKSSDDHNFISMVIGG